MCVCSFDRWFVDSPDKLNCAVNHSSLLWGINLGASAGRCPSLGSLLPGNSHPPLSIWQTAPACRRPCRAGGATLGNSFSCSCHCCCCWCCFRTWNWEDWELEVLPAGGTGILELELPLKLQLQLQFAVGKCIRPAQSILIAWNKFLKGFAGVLVRA